MRSDLTADIFKSNSPFRKTDGSIPYLHENIVENSFGTFKKVVCQNLELCHPRCVCENWNGYVVKHNYVIFNACHPEVFNTYIKYTIMCQSNTTNLYYVFIVLGQHVSILIESSSGPSKKIDPYFLSRM